MRNKVWSICPLLRLLVTMLLSLFGYFAFAHLLFFLCDA